MSNRINNLDTFISQSHPGTITVMDANTGNLIYYVGIDPAAAVVAAFEHNKGNRNTWTYDKKKARISKSGKTVSCGDFVALLN